ncbi:MAG TPA: PHP domain-containing protein [Nocardioidaceae bacterium]
MQIDLHTHSSASDGTQPPAELVAEAKQVGLDVIGLTDHDSAAGWAEGAQAARRLGVTLVPGMELSTRLDGAGVHLLAYLPDPTYPPLVDELTKILAGRTGRLAAMVGRLRAAGIDITEDEVLAQVGDAPAIGRPHIADVLVRKGVVADRSAAFRDWLNWGRPAYVSRYASPTREMIAIVNAAGGAAVLAHPWGRGSRQVLDRRTMAVLATDGLAGIEVDHQDHDESDRAVLRQMGRDLDLVVTGSSDYHGAGKVDHDLGCNVTSEQELDRLLTRAAAHAARSGRDVPAVVGA